MKKQYLILLTIIGLISFSGCEKHNLPEITPDNQIAEELLPINGSVIEGQYIVVLNESSTKFKSESEASYKERLDEVHQFALSLIRTKSTERFEIKQVFAKTLKGFSVALSEKNLAILQNDSRVKFIEKDRYIILAPPPGKGPGGGEEPVGQVIPYGISRVGTADGTGKTAWIIDSGIDLDHPDLNVDALRSVDFTGSRNGADDENGHGTHVAGTVAAIDNNIGVVGVASGATVVAVKVLNRRGSGTYSGVIAGVDYVAANASSGDVANMSLGGPVSDALDAAVLAASANVKFALAAGNESDNADNHSPARVNGPNIYTISAMDINDEWAYFSNFGPAIDYCEPGYSVYSTYKKGAYETLSGTSMAAPHMCGILLLGAPNNDGVVIGDPDGNDDPIGTL